MATIRQRGKGQWQAQVRKDGYPPQSKTFQYKSDAEQWAKGIERDMERGVFVSRSEAEKTLLGDLIDRYILEVVPKKRSSYNETQRLNFIKSKLGQINFAALQSKDITKFRDDRLAEGRAAATVVRELNNLSHVVDTAIKDWSVWIPSNPVKNVRRPSVSNARDRRLKPGEETAILESARQGRCKQLEPFFLLALETAMRLSELMGLTWVNVDLKGRFVFLPTTKNGKPRKVPLSTTAVSILQGEKNTHDLKLKEDDKVVYLGKKREDDRVFYAWARVDGFEATWRRTLDRAKASHAKARLAAGLLVDTAFLDDLRFHDLRHEATSRMATKIPNVIELASITGHSDLQMLKRYYHPKVEDLAEKLG